MFDDEILRVHQAASVTEFAPWLSGEDVRRKAFRCAAVTLLLHHAHSAAGEARSVVDLWDEVTKWPNFASVDPKELILGLLPYCYDPAVLVKSKELLSKPWDAHAFSDANSYEPENDGETRGISLVLFYDLPDGLRRKLADYFSPAGTAYQTTSKHHFTIASVQEETPETEVDNLCNQFVDGWTAALREQNGFPEVVDRLLQNPKIRADELRIQGEAVLLFGSNEGGFLSAMNELRLRLMRSVLLSVPPGGGRKQPLWAHSVLGRKVDALSAAVFQGLPQWPLPGVEARVAAKDPYLALMVFRDKKALLSPEREIRLRRGRGSRQWPNLQAGGLLGGPVIAPQVDAIVSKAQQTFAKPKEFFVAWQGVLTLAYEGFTPPLAYIKQELGNKIKGLRPENPGSRWPKTTLGAVQDGNRVTPNQLLTLRDICDKYNRRIRAEPWELAVKTLRVVLFQCRSLERRLAVHDIRLDEPRDPRSPDPNEMADVSRILGQFARGDLKKYWVHVAGDGNRVSHRACCLSWRSASSWAAWC